ncbi:MAG: hypothetical protein AB7I32_16155 [Gammaproteobacteria bacterium]
MNAELRRLLWLDFTGSRAGAMLIAVAAVAGLGWLLDGERFASTTATLMLASFIVLTIAWGANQVGHALLDELRARTWDQQRMSALSPWAMTWGKLVGASALPWLAGGSALLLHAFAAAPEALAWKLGLYVGGALFIHALALFGALLMLQRRAQARGSLVLRFIGGLLAGAMVYAFFQRERGLLQWGGHAWPTLPFLVVVLAQAAAWVLLACQRLMSEELQVRTQPWALPGFVVWTGALLGGFFVDADTPWPARIGAVAAFAVAAALAAAYFAAFALRTDPMLPRRLTLAAGRGDWSRAGSLLPPWLIALVCAGIAALLVQFTLPDDGALLAVFVDTRTTALALVAAGLRDLFVVHALGSSVREDRGEIVALLYLALVYWLLPGIFTLAGAHALGALLTPLPWVLPARALPVLALQAVAAIALAAWAWTRRVRPLTAGAGDRS